MTFSTNLNIRPLILAGSFVVSSAYATVTGFNTDPGGALWNRGDANTGFAVWDTFPTWQFADALPSSNFGITLPGFSQLNPLLLTGAGAGLFNVLQGTPVPDNTTATGGTNPGTNGDVMLGGGNNLSFVFEGEVSFTIRGIVLQVKRPGSTGTMVGHYSPVLSINGGPGIPFDGSSLSSGTGDTSSDAPGNYSVTSYFWNTSLASLSQEATNTFAIIAGNSETHRGVDGFELDVSSTTVVPEPTAVMTLLVGFGALGLMRPRRTV